MNRIHLTNQLDILLYSESPVCIQTNFCGFQYGRSLFSLTGISPWVEGFLDMEFLQFQQNFIIVNLRRIDVTSFFKFWQNLIVKPFGPGFRFNDLFKFSVSSWFSVGKLHMSRNGPFFTAFLISISMMCYNNSFLTYDVIGVFSYLDLYNKMFVYFVFLFPKSVFTFVGLLDIFLNLFFS